MQKVSKSWKERAVQPVRLGRIVAANNHTIGNGFTAKHLSEEMFSGQMDPLLMVDHFVMTAPTFPPHLHAGISAVTMMFEDAEGLFLNRDTLGHDLGLKAGDMYWLAAAAGAVHEERPDDGARTHALQIFVNLPSRLKGEPARSHHVLAENVPVLENERHRIRVILGRVNGVESIAETPEPMTMLDGIVKKGGDFSHYLPEDYQAFVYVVHGDLVVEVDGERVVVPAEHATTVGAGEEVKVVLSADKDTHFVLMAAKPIREPFVKAGPLVMSNAMDVQRTLRRYAEGKFGQIP